SRRHAQIDAFFDAIFFAGRVEREPLHALAVVIELDGGRRLEPLRARSRSDRRPDEHKRERHQRKGNLSPDLTSWCLTAIRQLSGGGQHVSVRALRERAVRSWLSAIRLQLGDWRKFCLRCQAGLSVGRRGGGPRPFMQLWRDLREIVHEQLLYRDLLVEMARRDLLLRYK